MGFGINSIYYFTEDLISQPPMVAVIEIGANFSLNMGSHHVWMHDVHDK